MSYFYWFILHTKKRRGVIVDTMNDAFRVGQNVAKDLEAAPETEKEGHAGLERLLRERAVKFVEFGDWETVDSVERQSGEVKGKPREKLTDVDDIISTVERRRPANS